jgi:hypothetical protein
MQKVFFFASEVPSLFFYLGGMPSNLEADKLRRIIGRIFIIEAGMETGIKPFFFSVGLSE